MLNMRPRLSERIAQIAQVTLGVLWLSAAAAGSAAADVTVTQQTSGMAAFVDLGGQSVLRIKGNKLRVDYTREEQTVSTIVDLDARRIVTLDVSGKSARILKADELAAEIAEKSGGAGRARITATKQLRKVAGHSCVVHDVAARFPFEPHLEGLEGLTGGAGLSLTMVVSGPACLSRSAPGYREFASFFRMAQQQSFLVGEPDVSAKKGPAKRAAAQASSILAVYKALADGGVALDQRLAIRLEAQGQGAMSAMIGEASKSNLTATVTKIDTAELSDKLFEVPPDFELED